MNIAAPTMQHHTRPASPAAPIDYSTDSGVSSPPQSPEAPAGFSLDSTAASNATAATITKPKKPRAPVDPNAPKKPPRIRKRKDPDAATAATKNADGSEKPKEKKPRKARDPNAPPSKRSKKNDGAARPVTVDLTIASTSGSHVASTPQPRASATPAPTHAQFAQIGKSEAGIQQIATPHGVAVHSHHQNNQHEHKLMSAPPPPQPISRPRYDPIRSASAENAANPDFMKYNSPPQRQSATPVPAHARASPSIASLISPPDAYDGGRSYSATPKAYDARIPSQASPPVPKPNSTFSSPSTNIINGYQAMPPPARPVAPSPIEPHRLASAPVEAPPKPKVPRPLTSDKSTAVSSPKTAHPTKEPAPAPTPTTFTPLPSTNPPPQSLTTPKPPPPRKERPPIQPVPNDCIVIEVPMTKPTGNYCNFMKEVEAKYGFDVAYPRLAEHKKRMAHMASLGAALEGIGLNSSNDDMPLDDSEGESGGDVDMGRGGGGVGGMDEDSATAAKKKRKAKANEYDKTDDFIDDAEQAWEEQALASRDGYFVWMGPLVNDDEKAAADKADGKKKGAGRARAGTGKTEAAGAKTAKVPGVNRGGKGTTVLAGTRKPRATKAEMEERKRAKEAKEALKMAREGNGKEERGSGGAEGGGVAAAAAADDEQAGGADAIMVE